MPFLVGVAAEIVETMCERTAGRICAASCSSGATRRPGVPEALRGTHTRLAWPSKHSKHVGSADSSPMPDVDLPGTKPIVLPVSCPSKARL